MKELLKTQLSSIHVGIEFVEFALPSSSPYFCIGCKSCFLRGEETCPHYASIEPIWSSFVSSDLLIFIFPMYVMRVPGHLKSLLDHFGCRWASHRPEPRMREKRALIITQGIGAPTKYAISDVSTSLRWWGVSDIRSLGIRLLEGVKWSDLSSKKRDEISNKLNRLAHSTTKKLRRHHLKTHFYFSLCRAMQRGMIKKGPPYSLDTQYWMDKGLL